MASKGLVCLSCFSYRNVFKPSRIPFQAGSHESSLLPSFSPPHPANTIYFLLYLLNITTFHPSLHFNCSHPSLSYHHPLLKQWNSLPAPSLASLQSLPSQSICEMPRPKFLIHPIKMSGLPPLASPHLSCTLFPLPYSLAV